MSETAQEQGTQAEVPPAVQGASRPRADADGAAIGSLVCAFVFPPAAVILGHVSRGQAKRRGWQPSAVATWGTVLGWVFSVTAVLAVLLVVLTAGIAANNIDQTSRFTDCVDHAQTVQEVSQCSIQYP